MPMIPLVIIHVENGCEGGPWWYRGLPEDPYKWRSLSGDLSWMTCRQVRVRARMHEPVGQSLDRYCEGGDGWLSSRAG